MAVYFFPIFLILGVFFTPNSAWAKIEDAIKALQDGRFQDAYSEFKLYSRHGNPVADYWIATMYLKGMGVEKNVDQAMVWLHRSAKQDHAAAMVILGNIHLEGQNGKKNVQIARGWFDKAAKKGDAYAMVRLGEIFTSGLGVPANPVIGMRYIKQAAKMGSLQGRHILGLAYLNGIGVEVDKQQALFWLQSAASAGFAPSRLKLQELNP